MIFFFNSQSELIKSIPDKVYQGSNKANRIWFIAPTGENIVQVAFRLPNGKVLPKVIMTPSTKETGLVDGNLGVKDQYGETFYAWYYDLSSSVTSINGNVTVQFYVSLTEDADGELATAIATFNVEKGIAPKVLPDAPSKEVYDQIITYLNSLPRYDGDGSKVVNDKGQFVNLQEIASTSYDYSALPEGDERLDFDAYLTFGKYAVSKNEWAEKIQGCPSNKVGILTVYGGSGSVKQDVAQNWRNVMQRYEDVDGNVFIRSGYSETGAFQGWSAWKKVLTIEDDSSLINLENGEGAYSLVQKTAEGEENQATAEGTYAGGKKSKTTAKRGFTHGNAIVNNGNSAASFGQVSKNDGNISLTFGNGIYNKADGSSVGGYAVFNNGTNYITDYSGISGICSDVHGFQIYNSGAQAFLAGRLLKNTVANKAVLGRANQDTSDAIFEIGIGKQIVVNSNRQFAYDNVLYQINFLSSSPSALPISITALDGAYSGRTYNFDNEYIDEESGIRISSYRVKVHDGKELCVGGLYANPLVFIPHNAFKVSTNGQLCGYNGAYFKTNTDDFRTSFIYLDGTSVNLSAGDGRKANLYMSGTSSLLIGDLNIEDGEITVNGKPISVYRHQIKLTKEDSKAKYMLDFTILNTSSKPLTTIKDVADAISDGLYQNEYYLPAYYNGVVPVSGQGLVSISRVGSIISVNGYVGTELSFSINLPTEYDSGTTFSSIVDRPVEL